MIWVPWVDGFIIKNNGEIEGDVNCRIQLGG